jgi:cell division protein FtsA
VRGITQLVTRTQYSTGVGLVKFGAKALAHARDRELVEPARGSRHRIEEEIEVEIPVRRPGRFWNWLRAAF